MNLELGRLNWDKEFIALNIIGNLYFVGEEGASIHFVDTGDGLIMFDSGYDQQHDRICDKMISLGLKVEDIKDIFVTHAHIDHMGGARRFSERTGAKIHLGKLDCDVAAGRNDALTWAEETNVLYDMPFEADYKLNDGDIFTRGNTTIRAVATPGHTVGAMTYIFNVEDGDTTYIAGLHGGMGCNTMVGATMRKKNLPFSLRDDYFNSCDKLKKEKIDIHLGNHMDFNHTREKYARLLEGDRLAFVDPDEWAKELEHVKKTLKEIIAKEEIEQ